MQRQPDLAKLDKLALRVAQGKSVRAAAIDAGIPESTAKRWARSPKFRARVDKIRREAVDQAVGRLALVTVAAAEALSELLKPKYEPETRLKAARAILADMVAMRKAGEFEDRIAALEKANAAVPGRTPRIARKTVAG